jgi:leader peptidase (prepilin peptidase)/N-methyltransferase
MRPVLCGLLFVSALTAASVSDIRNRTIPYSACILLAAAGLISFSPAHLFGLILAVPFFLASGFGRGGAGDTMLVAAASLTLGFRAGLAGMVLALLLFLLFAAVDRIILHILKRNEAPPSYPLAPFLSIGFIAAYIIL